MPERGLRRTEVLFGKRVRDKHLGLDRVPVEEAAGNRLYTHHAAKLRAHRGNIQVERLAIQQQAILRSR